MHLRRLVPSDAAMYQVLRLTALLESPTAFSASRADECGLPLAIIAAQMAPGSGRNRFGAFDGVQLVGVVGVARENGIKVRHKGLIGGVYLRADYRGRGLGRQLLAMALECAAGMDGLRQVCLSVTANNTSAIALYENMGFIAYGREPDALLVDGVLYDDVRMVRKTR